MKDALSKKILNKEVEKLPYTETELGEGEIVEHPTYLGRIPDQPPAQAWL